MSIIIDGKKIAEKIRKEIAAQVQMLYEKKKIVPKLAVILAGENPGSQVYVRMKKKACEEAGMLSEVITFPADLEEKELLLEIGRLNVDKKVHGILVQLPLPKHLSEKKVISFVSPEKDVDGLHPFNMGELLRGEDPLFLPCTPAGVVELILSTGEEIKGKNVVVVGRSNIVGKPVALLLLQRHATVTICHTRTKDLSAVCRQADILVAAAGRPRMITAGMVKEGVMVIDVGVNRTDAGLIGDVDFEAVKGKASYITPVPGGVGPMTIAMLLKNTIRAAERAE